jgi:hypothetical protein
MERHNYNHERVTPNQASEVRNLCERFDVSPQVVKEAIRVCRGDRQQIENYLKVRTGHGREAGFDNGSRNAPR